MGRSPQENSGARADSQHMQGLAERLQPYQATRVATPHRSGLWNALSAVACDASVLPPDPVSDVRAEEIIAEEARRALFSHLANL